MSGSGQVASRPSEQGRDDAAASAEPGARSVAGRPLLDDVDGLLDEIDAVLEHNAEEFVRGYVQKGGQ